MKNYSNDPQEMIDARIIELEKNISLLQENVSTVSDHLRETQRYLIKLSYNQSDITKRMAKWPYIVVNTESDEQ